MLIQSKSILKLEQNYFTIYTKLGQPNTEHLGLEDGVAGRSGTERPRLMTMGVRIVAGARSLAQARGQRWGWGHRHGPEDSGGVKEKTRLTMAGVRSPMRAQGQQQRHGRQCDPEDSGGAEERPRRGGGSSAQARGQRSSVWALWRPNARGWRWNDTVRVRV
jgi:hypothetical protein